MSELNLPDQIDSAKDFVQLLDNVGPEGKEGQVIAHHSVFDALGMTRPEHVQGRVTFIERDLYDLMLRTPMYIVAFDVTVDDICPDPDATYYVYEQGEQQVVFGEEYAKQNGLLDLDHHLLRELMGVET